MINIIKQEIPIDESLKKKLEFICDFAKVKPTIINGSIRRIDKTNLTYIEPHRIIINNVTFLIFNYSNEIEKAKEKIIKEQEEKAKQKPKKIVKEIEKEEDDYEL